MHVTDKAADNLIYSGQFTAMKKVNGRKGFVREVKTSAGVDGVLVYFAHTRANEITERGEDGYCRSSQDR